MMKKAIFMLAMLACILASCSDGGSEDPVNPTPNPEEVKAEITIDSGITTNGLSFGVTSGEQTISFSVNTNWTLSVASTTSGATWCKASATSGSKGTANVKFTVEENTGYDDRSVSVTIKAGSVSKTFTITQKGADALLVTTNKYEVAQEGGKIEVEVKANISYELAISETAKDWITESKSRALTTYKHTFEIALNEESEKREGEITFKSGDKVETVKVYQAGGAILLLSKNEFTVSDTGETISVDIKSNVEYGAQMPDVDWITDENSSRGMSSHTLKYVISANEGYESRSAEIIFYDKNSDLKDTLKVVQAQKDAIVISQKTYDVKAEGETIEVKIAANVDFEITMPKVDWIEQVSSRALKEHTLYFKVAKNEGEENRSAEIVFTNKNSGLEDKIAINQQGSLPQAEITINVTEAGTLASYIESGRISTLTSLKIIGDLNGNDLLTIRKMVSLKILDISETKIIAGGSEWVPSDNCIKSPIAYGGPFPSNVEYIYLPKTITELKGYYELGNSLQISSVFSSYSFSANSNSKNSSLKHIDLPNSLQTIGDATFMRTIDLNKIVIPEKVDSIGRYAFYNSGLTSFVSNSCNLDYIGDYAFENCNLTIIDLSKGVREIGKLAFYDICSITPLNIKLPSNIEKIGLSAFDTMGKKELEVNVYLEDLENWCNVELKNESSSPFCISENTNLYYENKLLTSLAIENVSEINDYVFAGCKSLKSVSIGNNVNSIGACTFKGCDNITNLNIGNSVQKISEGAFKHCSKLIKVSLGKSINKIESESFRDTKPSEVYCYATTPPTIGASSNFNKIDKKTAKLYVPKGTYSVYYLSNWGSIFDNIIEMEE